MRPRCRLQYCKRVKVGRPGSRACPNCPDQDKRLRLGAVPPPGEASLEAREQLATSRLAETAITAVGAPAAYDLRNVGGKNFITSDQGPGRLRFMCRVRELATVEGTFRRQRNNAASGVDLSEAHLFYCIARAQGRTCANGWWCDKGLDAFKTDGVCDEACYPYTAGDQNCSNRCADWQNRLTKITNWHKITSTADMKTWISTHGPLSCAFTVYNDFFSYKTGVYKHVSGAVAGGHCVSCIGYNDAGKYWICKNSWGPAGAIPGSSASPTANAASIWRCGLSTHRRERLAQGPQGDRPVDDRPEPQCLGLPRWRYRLAAHRLR